MINRTFKVLGRSKATGRQKKKSVYTSEADYLRYKDAIIRRWSNDVPWLNLDIEIYELIDGEWIRIENG